MGRMTLDMLVVQLRQAFGAELRTVVLYGSAAAGERLPKYSDLNVLVIVDALPAAVLRAAAATVRAWTAAGHPPPLTLTTAEWRASADVFPMEYADILERHQVLHGTPPFDGIAVARADLRLQLEYQTLATLLQLRRGVLAAGGDRRKLAELVAASASTVMVLFRAVVRLHGGVPETDYEALSRDVAAHTGLAALPFERVVRHARGSERLGDDAIEATVAEYLDGLERLVAHVDALVV